MLKRCFARIAVFIAFTLLASVASHAQTPKTVSVDSSVFVNPTGVYVNKGQVVMITATGTVNIADIDGPYVTDPTGTIVEAPDPGTGGYTYFTNNAGPTGYNPVVGIQKTIIPPYDGQLEYAPYGALVAALSTNPAANSYSDFPGGFAVVGNSLTITAPSSGYIYLAVNDVNNTYDNIGSFMATITIEQPPIASIEFTQAIQQYQTLTDLEASLNTSGEPLVPIIAGKPGVMRLYFNAVSSATTYNVLVVGPPGATKSIEVPPGCQPTDQRAHNQMCPSLDFYFTSAPTGTWNTNITVSDSNNNVLETESLNITSRTTSSIYLKGVSACVTKVTSSAKACGSAAALLSQTWMASLLMPTASLTSGTKWFGSVSSCLECTTPYAFDYKQWDEALAHEAAALYGVSDQLQDATTNQWTDYYAIYPASSPLVGDTSAASAGIPSHGIAGPDLSHDIGVDDTAQTVAHETGHTLNLQHTNVPVPPANQVTAPPGCWLTASQPGTYWTYPTNNVQSSGGMLEYGFNFTTQVPVDPNMTYDLMAYCSPEWISPIQYKRVIEQLNGGAVTSPSFTKPHVLEDDRPIAMATPQTIVIQPYWQIGGSIDPVAGVTFDPVFMETLAGTTDPGAGTYSIQVLGAGGQVLYTRYFTPTGGVEDSGTTGAAFPNPEFSQWVPVTAGGASFAVIDPNGITVGKLAITGVAPKVTITSPVAGFVGSNTQTISWSIVDPGVSSFITRVLYSPDGGTTWGQVSQTTWTSDTIDFTQVPGGANGLLQVLVSDGVNTGSAISVPFNVPRKTPSTIVITSPKSGYTQAAVDPLYLSGGVWDADDGVLTGSALQWSDSVQGALGSGAALSAKLQPGPHTLTLTGTDSDGNVITATTNVIMAGSGPSLTLTTSNLSTNCVSATIAAKPGSQGAALSTVQYSLNGGSSYKAVPLTALPYSFVVPGSSAVNLVAEAADLSRQMAAESTLVPLTAACVTGAPSISGGSSQSTMVGAAFGTPLTALVKDGNGNPVAGVAVNFTAPSTGASATFSPATATTAASGVASTVATANSSNGSYTAVATVPGFSTTAQYALNNTDFTLALSNPTIMVPHGSSTTAAITVTPLSGFNSPITLGCTGLPTGVTCSFSPASVTPSGSPLTSTFTITAANNASAPTVAMRWGLPTGGFVLALCLLGPGLRRRRKYLGIVMVLGLIAIVASATGCGATFKPFTSPVSVTATSGALTHTSSVSISVQ